MSVRVSFGDFGDTGLSALRVVDPVSREDLEPPLLFDSRPSAVSQELILCAGYMMYGGKADQLVFKGNIDSRFAQRFEELTGCPVNAPRVNLPDLGFVRSTEMVISVGSTLEALCPGRDQTRLTLLPSERFSGGLFGVKELLIPSNAWIFAANGKTDVVIASALLFAKHLLAEKLKVSDSIARNCSESNKSILELVNISLESDQ